MKWVTRKELKDLSTRQKYTRINLIRQQRLRDSAISYYNSTADNAVEQNSHQLLNNTTTVDTTINDSMIVLETDSSNNITKETPNVVENVSIAKDNSNSTMCVSYHSNIKRLGREKDEAQTDNFFANDSENLVNNFENFQNLLRDTILDLNINHIQTNGILSVLRSHDCFRKLPKDSRTLLKTGRNKISLLPIDDSGFYWHIGLVRSLTPTLIQYNELPKELILELNTDGVSLSRSDPRQFWPIQMRVLNIKEFKPLIIGIFKGNCEPSNITLMFQPLINEVQEVQSSGGIVINKLCIPFKFERFIGDEPAEAKVGNHKQHGAYEPCSKCKIVGTMGKNKRIFYPGVSHEKRCSKMYRRIKYKNHQKGKSPLLDLKIDPVKDVPFDLLHAAYHGLGLKLERAWFLGKYGASAKLKPYCRREIFERYAKLAETCPSDYARRPKPLIHLKKLTLVSLKGTEWRHFMLYAGPVVLFGVLKDDYYHHFLLAHVATRILTSKNHSKERLDVAERAFQTFVKFAPKLYNRQFLSFIIHSLLHLTDDARRFGPLDNCSTFIYENNNTFLKKMLRNHAKPLEQIANRLKERSYLQHKVKKCSFTKQVSNKHENGPVPENYNEDKLLQYTCFNSDSFKFTIDGRNNFCQLESGCICKIENILADEDEEHIFFFVKKFTKINDFYEKPVKSSTIGIYKCSELDISSNLICANNVTAKCYKMPSYVSDFNESKKSLVEENTFIFATMIHTEKI